MSAPFDFETGLQKAFPENHFHCVGGQMVLRAKDASTCDLCLDNDPRLPISAGVPFLESVRDGANQSVASASAATQTYFPSAGKQVHEHKTEEGTIVVKKLSGCKLCKKGNPARLLHGEQNETNPQTHPSGQQPQTKTANIQARIRDIIRDHMGRIQKVRKFTRGRTYILHISAVTSTSNGDGVWFETTESDLEDYIAEIPAGPRERVRASLRQRRTQAEVFCIVVTRVEINNTEEYVVVGTGS
jgi:hypothetical protein